MQSSVGRALLTGHVVPFVHLDVAVLETLELELRTVLRVPGREALVAGLAVKEHHVAEDLLRVEHAPQQLLAESGVDPRRAYRCMVRATDGHTVRERSESSIFRTLLTVRRFTEMPHVLAEHSFIPGVHPVTNSCDSLKIHEHVLERARFIRAHRPSAMEVVQLCGAAVAAPTREMVKVIQAQTICSPD